MSVRIIGYQGVCDSCGEPSPEIRESEQYAEQDATECPCRDEIGGEES